MTPISGFNIVLGVLLIALARPFGRMIADFQRRVWKLDLDESASAISMMMSILAGIALIVRGLTR